MSKYELHHGDCRDFNQKIDFSSIDAAIFDPPYGIQSKRTSGINKSRQKGDYQHADFPDTHDYLRMVILPYVNMLIENIQCVIFTPGNKNLSLYPQPDSFGAFYQPSAVGMQTFGNVDAQPIFYYGKNATKANLGKKCSFVMTSKPRRTNHPCPKPLKEWTDLIENHTLPGQTIFDPFMGSGTTGIACMKTGRNFVGIELGYQYYCDAKREISNAANDFNLSPAERMAGRMSLFGWE